jgi:hypothetical protein
MSRSASVTMTPTDEREFTISGLAPSQAQKRLALGVFVVLLTGLVVLY